VGCQSEADLYKKPQNEEDYYSTPKRFRALRCYGMLQNVLLHLVSLWPIPADSVAPVTMEAACAVAKAWLLRRPFELATRQMLALVVSPAH
jgi:hypothetical protein